MSGDASSASHFLTITGLTRVSPAEFAGQWDGIPLRIILDTSATLKLLGDAQSSEYADVLSMKTDIVAQAALRIIDMRREEPCADESIMVSALDLEVGSSKPRLRERNQASKA